MAIHVNPERFHAVASKPLTGSQYLQSKERETLLESGVKTRIEGDIYTKEGVQFDRLSKAALRSETLIKPQAKPDEGQRFVAFRNPDDDKDVLVIQLDKETLGDLKNAFSKGDFFVREDGIVRLNGTAERYVAGWLKEIVHTRGYGEADGNKDGTIDESEQHALRLGFDHDVVYEHAGEDVTAINTSVGARRYQAYGDTFNARNPTDIITTQALAFKRTAYEELNHTIDLDQDKNGAVSLEEGLATYANEDKNVHETLTSAVQNAHRVWINQDNPTLEPNRLAYRDLSMLEIQTQEEREQALEYFKIDAQTALKAFGEHALFFKTTLVAMPFEKKEEPLYM
ncbi:MAG: hypothetical protein IBX45_07805 [Campylobacterales bacterium]|nr:hypothetical protein [Campylobacterales bacterium]